MNNSSLTQHKRQRRKSAPYSMERGVNNDSFDHRMGEIQGIISSTFNLKPEDVAIDLILKRLRWAYNKQDIRAHLEELQNKGAIFTTFDDDHFRPVH